MSSYAYHILFFFFGTQLVMAQQDSLSSLGDKVIKLKTQSYQTTTKSSRRMMHYNQELNLFYVLSSRLMYLYQNLLSEQIQAECVYVISCSEHAKLKIEEKGLIIGILAGGYQLMNCFTGVVYDYPWYKITQDFKVINEDE